MSVTSISFTVEKKDDGYTHITPDIKVGETTYASPFVRRAAKGDGFEVGFVVKHPGEIGKPKETILQKIPAAEIGANGIQINGNVTLGDISFLKPDTSDKTGRKTVADESKSVKIVGTDGADQVVINGNLGKTKIEIDLGKGDDKVIIESKSKGTGVNANFGEGNDELIFVGASDLKINSPADGHPETNTTVTAYPYVEATKAAGYTKPSTK